ncbi:MAG: sugar transferase [Planctomycetota bacterium]|nr:MAG: sugar transferase [Planctomycetota bacterium]
MALSRAVGYSCTVCRDSTANRGGGVQTRLDEQREAASSGPGSGTAGAGEAAGADAGAEAGTLTQDVRRIARHAASPGPLRGVVVLVDFLLIAVAFLAATALRDPSLVDVDVLPLQLLVVSSLMVVGLQFHDAYELERVRSAHDLLTRLVLGAFVGLGLVVLASYVVPEVAVGRGVFVLHTMLVVPALLVWRYQVFGVMRDATLRRRALVLGEPEAAARVADAVRSARFGGAEVVGILTPRPIEAREVVPEVVRGGAGRDDGRPPAPIPVLGSYEDVSEIVRRDEVARVIVVKGPSDDLLPVADLIRLCRGGLQVEDGAAAYEAVTGKVYADRLTPAWLAFTNEFDRSPLERRIRGAVERTIALCGLVLLTPLWVVIALAIKLDSRGPILFRQRRVGRDGRLFELVKFRTMRPDAEAGTGPVWAQEGDPRVTPVGRILRSTRLDELPQLWNVVRGDMSFVGPRPERPEFVVQLREQVPYYDLRHSVKPGITGWAQINYGYGSSVADAVEKLHYDLFYIRNLSLLLDVEVLIGTLRVVLGASNRN